MSSSFFNYLSFGAFSMVSVLPAAQRWIAAISFSRRTRFCLPATGRRAAQVLYGFATTVIRDVPPLISPITTILNKNSVHCNRINRKSQTFPKNCIISIPVILPGCQDKILYSDAYGAWLWIKVRWNGWEITSRGRSKPAMSARLPSLE